MELLDQPGVLVATAGATLAAAAALWVISLLRRDASVVDPFWGPGFVLIAGVALIVGQGYGPRRILIAAMVSLWGLRLGAHLLARNLREGEDRRYRAMREYWGASFGWVSLFTVFLLQGVLMWLISLPLQAVATASQPDRMTVVDGMGALLWAIGLVFEAVGDRQLSRFKADHSNAGKVLDRGLWAYTRHPNYFGDALVWWGIYVVASVTPGGAVTILGPLLMTLLLLKVSGVAMLERDIADRRPGYRDYVARTSSFFPLPPKSARRVDGATRRNR